MGKIRNPAGLGGWSFELDRLDRVTLLIRFAPALIALLLTSCFVFPVPTSGKKLETGTRIQTSDLAFVQFDQTTREEIESKLGKPWTNYVDLKVSVYYWEVVEGY